MNQAAKDLLLLFQRPLEPLFTKRDNGRVTFDMPEDYFTDRYRPICQGLLTRYGEDVDRRVTLRPITYPDLSFASGLKVRGPFSLFNDSHRKMAGKLVKIFLDQPDAMNFLATACYIKDRCNPYFFQYCLTVATQHRPDTDNLSIPAAVQIFPDQFVDSTTFPKAREEGTIVLQDDREFVSIPMNFTATDAEIEQRLAYFREDIGVNLHHWHWHLVYPAEGELSVVDKDRRGELFYYMHNQIVARFNSERICNRLGRARALDNFREPIPEGYFPKIIRSTNNRSYPARVPNSTLSDLNRPADNIVVSIDDMERWRDRICDAIEKGFVVDAQGNRIALDEFRGIDILGNIVEASRLTPDRDFYGNFHNEGHNMIAYVHDPDGRFLEEYGVMGDTTTAMRDPIFYRWHTLLDSIFRRHKEKLRRYDVQTDLGFNGISVDTISVQITKGKNPAPNILLTFWQRSDVDLSAGLDFGPEGNIFAEFTHLQHAPFEYRIKVTNSNGKALQGTCRIFFCPRYDENGQRLQYKDQRYLLFEMDKFTVTLSPGINSIRRRSDESTVTIPYERSFRRIGSQFQPVGEAELAQFQFCGCGWPQHMLIPRGTAEGLMFDIFVMISNFEGDTVNQNVDQTIPCNDAASFCGLKDSLYPDRRSMGFPFDRVTNVANLIEFSQQSSNMGLGECMIRFTNTILNRQ